MINIKHLFFSVLMAIGCHSVKAQDAWQQKFVSPSQEARPWTFWYWMFGAVTPEGITADLEAMRQVGLGGAYLMPIKGVEQGAQYEGKAQQLTPEFWRMVYHSMKEADRLGLKLGMHICDGFALAGGPWMTPEESMQKVVWSDTIVSGGNIRNLSLPQPEAFEGYYEDIAVYAIPLEKQPEDSALQPEITIGNLKPSVIADSAKAVNRDAKGVIRSSYPCWIQYAYKEPVTVSNIEIILGGNNYQAHRLRVLASNDGKKFNLVKQLVPARHGWQNTDFQSTHAIPVTTARYFRFEWTPDGSEAGSEDLDAAKWKPNLKINNIALHAAPRIHQWEGKAGLVWRVASTTKTTEVPDTACLQPDDVMQLPLYQGKLTARLSEGKWRILRMGHTATGHVNATAGGGKGLECDKFSPKAVRKQFDHWFAKAFENTDPNLARRVLKYMHVDSWECGSQNWSDNFAAEFKKRRGYDLMPYLPLLAGIPMESVTRSEQVLRDVRTTIGELVTDVFYTVLADCARRYDCQFSAECVAPTMVSDGFMHYQKVDLPMGEFWLNSPTHDKPNDMLDAISGAHIYGKNIIQAEGFTEIRGTWNEDPAMLKPLLDRNFALGINKLFFHVYTHNPWLDQRPGMTLDGIGLFFQRDQTWWKEAKAFVDYISRCQTLLQYGHPVVDIAVFTGEEIPRRAILPERLVSMLPGIYGQDRVQSEKIRLANVGQPTRVRPVGVTHSANMADPEDWVNPMRGYAYDSFNKDALLRLVKAENGRMVLPGGASYRVLILPTARPMNPDNLPLSAEAKTKVEELQAAGVVIPKLPYMASDFSAYGLERDVILPEQIAYTHRSGEEMDVYFIANQVDSLRTFNASFRVDGRNPQLWDAVTGSIIRPAAWKEEGGQTEVTLSLPANGSVFVVFPKGEEVSSLSESANKKVLPVEMTSSETVPLKINDWTVTFPDVRKTLNRSILFDWSREEDEKIKYYSGRALYKSLFMWKNQNDGRIILDLGKVANIATVRINSIHCGIAWTAPYEIDITDALRNGSNVIEVEVVNTWANALRGADEGKAPFEDIWTNGKFRLPGDELLPAGWLGPMQVYKRK